MRGDAGASDSIWPSIDHIQSDGPLQEDVRTNTCIIGAGVVGLCTAYELMRAGNNVIVLDDGPIGGGETGRTTAHISDALDDGYQELTRLHGLSNMRLAAAQHTQAVDWFEHLVQQEGIGCGWRRLDGYLMLAPGQDRRVLEDELEAAQAAGVDAEVVERVPGDVTDGPAIRFPRQARLEPTAFLDELSRILRAGGVKIHTHTHAARLEDDGHAVVTTQGHVITCHHVVEATNAPVFDHPGLFSKQSAFRTYAIAADIGPDSVPDYLYWDTDQPYHYVRLAGRGNQIVIGGADHRTGHRPDAGKTFAALEEWGRKRFRMERVTHRWSGQVWEPLDGLALIGRADNTIIATGDSGHGWTHAAIAATLIRDLVAGRKHPARHLFDPHRTRLSTIASWVKENAQTLASMSRVLMPGEIRDPEELSKGEAAIVRRGIRLYACHRDEQGVLHQRLAVCSHMGCIVDWNATEKSWDCPCHGSRYDAHGTVVNGPANEDLGDQGDPRRHGIRGHVPDAAPKERQTASTRR